jgi:hypothetical protein
MKIKIFHSKKTIFISIFLFVMLLFSDTFPQTDASKKEKTKPVVIETPGEK